MSLTLLGRKQSYMGVSNLFFGVGKCDASSMGDGKIRMHLRIKELSLATWKV